MNNPRLLATDPCSLLDSLLGQAYDCAVEQRKHEIAEIILQALEAHAKDAGDETVVNGAYLQGIRSVTTLSPGSKAENPRRCPW